MVTMGLVGDARLNFPKKKTADYMGGDWTIFESLFSSI